MATPRSVGRYQVSERVAAGSFATVWRARDHELDTDVAIKILADNWADNADVRSRFVEEARMLRRAYSDRIVRVYDIGTIDDGRPYFVMSFADRGTLYDRLVTGRLATDVALRYTRQASQGIAALHELGILHRDIKPSNIVFISTGGSERLLIADLGLAKSMVHGTALTITGGTPGYMAPEQAVPGGQVDPRTDVYGLGAVAYHMLTGRPTTTTLAGGPITPPSQLRADLAGPIEAVVMRALDPDPANRWPDVAAFIRALDELPAPASSVLDPDPAAAPAPLGHPTPTTADAPPQPAPTTADVPPQPASEFGAHQAAPPATDGPTPRSGPPHSGPPHSGPPRSGGDPHGYPGQPVRPRKRVLGLRAPVFYTLLVSLVLILIILVPVGIFAGPKVWIRIPQTVASDDGAISIKVRPIWTTDDYRIEPKVDTVDTTGFGVAGGKGLRISTQAPYGTETVERYDDIRGVSVIAGRELTKVRPEAAVGTYPGDSWDSVENHCAKVSEREVTPRGFTKGVVRIYKCFPYYQMHAVVTRDDAAAHIFVNDAVDGTPEQLEDMVRTIEIDASKLP